MPQLQTKSILVLAAVTKRLLRRVYGFLFFSEKSLKLKCASAAGASKACAGTCTYGKAIEWSPKVVTESLWCLCGGCKSFPTETFFLRRPVTHHAKLRFRYASLLIELTVRNTAVRMERL